MRTRAAVAYLRVSTAEQAERGFGFDVQRERVAAFCRAERLPLAAVHVDAGVSGTVPLEERRGVARDGWSTRRVAAQLTAYGTLGRRWHPTQGRRVVRRDVYKRGPVGERIVDGKVWARANAVLTVEREQAAAEREAAEQEAAAAPEPEPTPDSSGASDAGGSAPNGCDGSLTPEFPGQRDGDGDGDGCYGEG